MTCLHSKSVPLGPSMLYSHVLAKEKNQSLHKVHGLKEEGFQKEKNGFLLAIPCILAPLETFFVSEMAYASITNSSRRSSKSRLALIQVAQKGGKEKIGETIQ